ncbi:helix-turn-helix domain-containing protein [Streptomyces sp. NBC_00311]|uniref:helix-turn-helix domain-containing protein n=1 Tax=unclassified Streptomyces TaxID=2593676 RepID=UPI003FA75EB9
MERGWSGGRPRMISSQVREHICLIARTSPADWKISAFSTWSLTKLAEHLVKQNVVPAVSRETLRRIPRELDNFSPHKHPNVRPPTHPSALGPSTRPRLPDGPPPFRRLLPGRSGG